MGSLVMALIEGDEVCEFGDVGILAMRGWRCRGAKIRPIEDRERVYVPPIAVRLRWMGHPGILLERSASADSLWE